MEDGALNNEQPLLAMLKEQLNIDFEEKDGELRHLLAVAEDYVCKHANLPPDAEEKESPIYIQAVILLAKGMFETGGTTISSGVIESPYGFRLLMNSLYRTI